MQLVMNGSIPLHASLAYTTAAAEDPFDFDLFTVLASESPPSLASAEPVPSFWAPPSPRFSPPIMSRHSLAPRFRPCTCCRPASASGPTRGIPSAVLAPHRTLPRARRDSPAAAAAGSRAPGASPARPSTATPRSSTASRTICGSRRRRWPSQARAASFMPRYQTQSKAHAVVPSRVDRRAQRHGSCHTA